MTMTTYIRKCSLDVLAQWFCDSDNELEEEFGSLVKLLQDEQSLQILVNLAKDEVLDQTLKSLDGLVESRLTYKETEDSIFEDVVSDELATSFLYRLAKLA